MFSHARAMGWWWLVKQCVTVCVCVSVYVCVSAPVSWPPTRSWSFCTSFSFFYPERNFLLFISFFLFFSSQMINYLCNTIRGSAAPVGSGFLILSNLMQVSSNRTTWWCKCKMGQGHINPRRGPACVKMSCCMWSIWLYMCKTKKNRSPRARF